MPLNRFVLAAAALGTGLFLSGLARASSCDLPDPPGCARDSDRFGDLNDYEDCRRQMARYRAQVGASLTCIRDEYDSTTARFDRRANR